MKQTCPECKSVIELNEKEYKPKENVEIICPLCGSSVIFTIPEEEPPKPQIIEKLVVKEVDNPDNLRRIKELENEIRGIKRNQKIYDHKIIQNSAAISNSDSITGIEANNNKFYSYFSFNGRIDRSEYLISLILYYVVNAVLGWTVIVIPFLIWILLAQGAKRCHDLNHSGWFQIIPFYFLWMLLAKGDISSNDYGYKSR